MRKQRPVNDSLTEIVLWAAKNDPPTSGRVAEALGMCKSSAMDFLAMLVRGGYLSRERSKIFRNAYIYRLTPFGARAAAQWAKRKPKKIFLGGRRIKA